MKELLASIQRRNIDKKCEIMRLKYYLCTNQKTQSHCEYGISIEKYRLTRDGMTRQEEKTIFDIFSTREDTMLFLQKCAEGVVTPISVQDIVDDMLCLHEIEAFNARYAAFV